MKKFLSGIFSATLIAATAVTPSYAQLAKKAVDPQAAEAANSAVQAAQKAPGLGVKGLYEAPVRQANGGIRTAKTGAFKPLQPAKAAPADFPTVYGDIIYFDGAQSSDAGLGQVKADGTHDIFLPGINAKNGGIYDGTNYYATNYTSFLGMVFISTTVVEVSTMEKVGSFAPTTLDALFVGGGVYDPTTSAAYGVTYTSDGSGLQFSKLTYTEESVSITKVGNVDYQLNSIYVDASGQLYGIALILEGSGDDSTVTGSTFGKIDKATGAFTAIGQTGVAPVYISSGVIDPKTGKLYWNVCDASETGCIYQVNLTTGAATKLFDLTLNDEVVGMFIPAPEAVDGAPAACTGVVPSFTGGSLTGGITLTTPTQLYGGGAGSGILTVKVVVDGVEVGSKLAGWGKTLTVPVDLADVGAGKYTFTVYCSNAAGDGPKTRVKNVWVGNDTPEATKATLQYANGNMEVSWTAVTGTVNGGYLDTANLTYTVTRADGTVAASGLTVTSFSEAVSEPAYGMKSYYYTVNAVAGDLVSAPAQTNTVSVGAIVPPVEFDFNTDKLNGWTVIDANGDNKVWTAQTSGNAVKMSYNSKMAMDDWLITPALQLGADSIYVVSFDLYAQSTSYVEKIEVLYGTAPTAEAMTDTLLLPTEVNWKVADKVHYEEKIVPQSNGRIYVGFHGISDADKYGLYVANVAVSAGVSENAPAQCTDLTVTPGANAALTATVAFKTPTVTNGGAPLSSITKIEVIRDGNVVKTFAAPALGSQLSFTETLTEDGEVEYTVVAYNAAGAGPGISATAYVGNTAPASPTDVVISRTPDVGSVNLTWNPVTADTNGAPFAAGSIKYTVYDAKTSTVLADDLTGTSYTYQAVAAGDQNFVQLAVAAKYKTLAGSAALSDMIPVGTPYDGLDESFADGKLHYIWGLRGINGGTVKFANFTDITPVDDDGGYITIEGSTLDSGADFFSGLVSLAGTVNPAFSFYVYNIAEDDIDELAVSVRTADAAEYTTLYTSAINAIDGTGDGWKKVTVGLGAYANQTVQLQITGITKQYKYKILDALKVGSQLDYDMKAAGITAPSVVGAGADYQVTVKVSNEGAKAAEGVIVELYRDGDLYQSEELTSVNPSASANVTFDCAMSAIATEPVEYYAKVVYAQDENQTNNQTVSVSVTPKASGLDAPTGLTASNDAEAGGIKLAWSAPDAGTSAPAKAPAAVTEDFEDGEAFASEYGEWYFIDGDQSPVGGFQGFDLPGINPGTTLGSFWIWDQAYSDANAGNTAASFQAHSGSKYLFSLFRYDDKGADDYAVSPAIYTGGQTISFWCKSYSDQYPEKVEILYTTGDGTTAAEFAGNVAKAAFVPSKDWTEYTAEIPAGATHFAIHSIASGAFMLEVDDVTFIPGDGSVPQVVGYNVYRDGVKINNEVCATPEYLDIAVTSGEQYTYVVTAVYDNGRESGASNEAVITSTINSVDAVYAGVTVTVEGKTIVVAGAEGQQVAVASANGAVVYSAVGEAVVKVGVENGVYVVKAGKLVKKVFVK